MTILDAALRAGSVSSRLTRSPSSASDRLARPPPDRGPAEDPASSVLPCASRRPPETSPALEEDGYENGCRVCRPGWLPPVSPHPPGNATSPTPCSKQRMDLCPGPTNLLRATRRAGIRYVRLLMSVELPAWHCRFYHSANSGRIMDCNSAITIASWPVGYQNWHGQRKPPRCTRNRTRRRVRRIAMSGDAGGPVYGARFLRPARCRRRRRT